MALSRLIIGGAVAGLFTLILLPSCTPKYRPWGKQWSRPVKCNGQWMTLPPATARPGAYGVKVEMFERWEECPCEAEVRVDDRTYVRATNDRPISNAVRIQPGQQLRLIYRCLPGGTAYSTKGGTETEIDTEVTVFVED